LRQVSASRAITPARPLPAGVKPPVVRFEDVAARAGVTGVNVNGSPTHKPFLVESTGNGVAIFDYDDDGWPDIFFVNGAHFAGEKVVPARFYLYRNLGGLKFADVTEKAGLAHTSGWGQGVCAGDVDNDGHTDLFVTQWGEKILFHNQGDGTFRDETKQRGLAASQRWSTGCAFVDFNRDGNLDLVVAHYIDFDPAHTPHSGERWTCRWKGVPVLCGPRGLPAETISLYENDGHGQFTDVSDRMHITTPRLYYCFAPLTGDFDGDGWPDIYVACDSIASLYFHNLDGKGFAQMGMEAGVAYNEDGREQAGMGTTAAFDHTGFPDIFKTNFSDDTPTFYRNHGKNNFSDATAESGLGASARYVGWGTAALDIDNDGWKDLIAASGHVYPEVDTGDIGESFAQPRRPFWNRHDGEFYDLSAGPRQRTCGAAAASCRGTTSGRTSGWTQRPRRRFPTAGRTRRPTRFMRCPRARS
jgi:enediyne biosynthesis protein E4